MQTDKRKVLVGVIAQPDGSVSALYSDLPLSRAHEEPLDSVCKALLDLGAQPESVEALRERTMIAAQKRRERIAPNPRSRMVEYELQVAKARSRLLDRAAATEVAKNAIDHLRETVPGADDEFVLALARGDAIPFCSAMTGGVTVYKAKHDGRQHPQTGRFTPMSTPKQTKVGAIVWTHQDDRRMIGWQLGRPKNEDERRRRQPNDNGAPSVSAYGEAEGTGTDTYGNQHPGSSAIE